MKKIIALIGLGIVLSNFSEVIAQVYLGGSVSINNVNANRENDQNQNVNENKNFNFQVSPQLGFYLSENFVLGFGLTYSSYNNSYKDEGENYLSNYERKGSTYQFMPFSQYYISISEKIKFINNFYVSAGFSNSERINRYSNSEDIDEISGFVIGAGYSPGFCFNLSEKLMLELFVGNINYYYDLENETDTSSELETEYTNTTSGFQFNYNQIGLGLAYKF